MSYLLGLKQLGHDAYLFEDVSPKRCFDQKYRQVGFERWEGKSHFESLTRVYGIWPKCCLIYNCGEASFGMSMDDAVRVARSADLLLNIDGRLQTPEILDPIPCRAYVDIAPAKAQVYEAEYGIARGFDRHHYFFTVGQNIGTAECEIPTADRVWQGFFSPVVLSRWPAIVSPRAEHFTTISNWAKKHTFNFQGRFSGEKSDQWHKFVHLPKKTNQKLEIALNISLDYRQDIQLLKENGWILTDPNRFQGIEDYRRFIAASRAEFSVANNRYVQFNTGWISDRTARYLASGKPVLVQSTGIEDSLPTGKGFLTFKTMDEALDGIERINKDYSDHCRAARELALEFFDSDKVLSNMLKTVACS